MSRSTATSSKATPVVTPDKGVPLPHKSLPEGSRTKLVSDLAVGKSWSEVERLSDGATWASVCDAKAAMHRVAGKTIQRAKARNPQATYTSAAGEIRASDGDILVVLAITRLS